MKRLLIVIFGILSLIGSPAGAQTFELAFTPPQVDATAICKSGPAAAVPSDQLGNGSQDALTEQQRIGYLIHDIRRMTRENPNKWFDFISALIDRRAEVDSSFSDIDRQLAQIDLYVAAGRLDELQAAGLVPALLKRRDELGKSQEVKLAQYYINGLGVPADPELGQDMVRDAALSGNAEALFEMARMSINKELIKPWTAPLDLTLTMALGGILGPLDENVCKGAERIAEEYRNGRVLTPNPNLALVWSRFAADMGSAQAAWDVVEHQLTAKAADKDNTELAHYLQLAVDRGYGLTPAQVAELKASSGLKDSELARILGFNYSEDTGRSRPTLSDQFRLTVKIDTVAADTSSPYLIYLKEIAGLKGAPAWVFREIGKEILNRQGRWGGEAEARGYFKRAADLGDPEAMQMLAEILMRYRDEPVAVTHAVNLLEETVSRYGMASSMDRLDALYRCQVTDAPRLEEANYWARNYRASMHQTVQLSATDLMQLSPYREPETLAQLQSQALNGRPDSLAKFAQLVQVAEWGSAKADKLWAGRVDRSDKALESYAQLESELASNPEERNLAIELYRRIYLNNGVTTALDLAVALVEYDGRNPETAKEIVDLLTKAGNRGEGAAIRLLSRLQAGSRTGQSVYEQFRDVIEQRGDFLALMFAIPYLPADKVDDYINRAVSVMSCGSKDADELGNAYAILLNPEMSYHWRRIGLHFRGGSSMSKLRLTDRQMSYYGQGAAPDALAVATRDATEGSRGAEYQEYRVAADPNLPSYNPQLAAKQLGRIVARGEVTDREWVLAALRRADDHLRAEINKTFDARAYLRKVSQSGDTQAGVDYAMLLRKTATQPADLQESAEWLKQAADRGNVEGMREYGYALMLGLGTHQDPVEAAVWLNKAAYLGDRKAADQLRLLRLKTGLTQ